jgi:hypothetical protein
LYLPLKAAIPAISPAEIGRAVEAQPG